MSNDQSLSERIEFPTIPLEAQTKIAQLQDQFVRAEVEQRKFVVLLVPFSARGVYLLHVIGLATKISVLRGFSVWNWIADLHDAMHKFYCFIMLGKVIC